MDKNEKIGFHKGALDCLVKERAELARILSIVDALIQMHTKSLADEGVDIKAELEKARNVSQNTQQQAGTAQPQQDDNFVNIDSAMQDAKKNF